MVDRKYFIYVAFITTLMMSATKDAQAAENRPIIVTTWSKKCFQKATELAWLTFQLSNDRLSAIVEGCSYCEDVQCDGTIGYGGSPDELGRITLDALLFDGPQHRIGSVAQLSKVRSAIKVAWAVMNYTKHTLIAGEQADNFAIQMGFKESDLTTKDSTLMWERWINNKCQPNFRQNVTPDPTRFCGPYEPKKFGSDFKSLFPPLHKKPHEIRYSHDTVGMLIVDSNGDMTAGTSTNGASHKIPGRVSDAGLTGAGAYVDNDVGAAAATGDGDVMQRFVPSFRTVENMRHGMKPNEAAEDSVRQIARFYPEFNGAVIALTKNGTYGAACHGIGSFTYCIRNGLYHDVQLVTVKCVDSNKLLL